MVAMVFMTLSIFAVISVNAYTLKATRGNRNRQIANQLASSQLALAESVLKIDFHTPKDNIQTYVLKSDEYPTFTFQVDDLGYEDTTQTLRGVQTTVYWYENGEKKSYELSTTYYNY